MCPITAEHKIRLMGKMGSINRHRKADDDSGVRHPLRRSPYRPSGIYGVPGHHENTTHNNEGTVNN